MKFLLLPCELKKSGWINLIIQRIRIFSQCGRKQCERMIFDFLNYYSLFRFIVYDDKTIARPSFSNNWKANKTMLHFSRLTFRRFNALLILVSEQSRFALAAWDALQCAYGCGVGARWLTGSATALPFFVLSTYSFCQCWGREYSQND